jgi:NADH-ubiquinone oxidoreductase chain 6
MNTLFIINETFTNGYKSNMLDIIALLSILCGIFVLTSKNPIVSVLFLIGLFGSISIYLIILGLSFIGLSYLIVYIGAVSILFLFILMLINIRISELQNNTANSLPLGAFIIISLTYTIFHALPYDISILNNYNNVLNNKFFNIYSNNNENYLYKNKLISTYNNDFSFVTSNN